MIYFILILAQYKYVHKLTILYEKKMKKLKKNTHWKENQKKIIPMRFVVKKGII